MALSYLKRILDFNYRNIFGDKDLKVPRIIFVVGLFSVVLIASYANYSLNEKDKYRFRILTKEVLDTIYDRLGTHLIILRGISGVFHEKNDLSNNELENYVESMELNKYFPGSLGIGYISKINATLIDDFVKRMRTEHHPAFEVSRKDMRDYYFPITYLSPKNDANRALLGTDLFGEERQRVAMQRAAENGLPAMTNKIIFKNAIDGKSASGFHIYLPVYPQLNDKTQIMTSSMDNVVGFVFTPIVSKDFFKAIFKKGYEKFVQFKVYDTSLSGEEALFSTDVITEQCKQCDIIEEDIEVLGNKWTLTFTALPAFYSGSNKLIVFVLCIGQLILVFVISALSYSQNKAKIKAESANRDKEELLVRERVARGQAEQASRLKEEFLATVSHELRNPLNAILGWAQIVNRPNTSAENIAKGIKTIEKNVHVQAKLIDDLLEMSRITAGKLMLDIKATDMSKVLESALETVDTSIKAKNIRIEKNIASNLPQIKADETRLQQVIWNLLSNAIKFSPESSAILISIKKVGSQIEFSIKDSGPGISPDFIPNIFDRFRQENSKITKKHGGLGLGLAITKSLVELHGGVVEVKSEGIGKGSEFCFRLPILSEYQSEARNTGPSYPDTKETYGRKSIKQMNILVVDDEADSREMLAVLINEKGASVQCASSVDEALNKIGGTEFDLIISDIGMPEKDGYELARTIRNHKNQSLRIKPIIALSAYARENDRNLSRDAGFSAHLAKPLNVNELFQLIENLV